MVCRQRSDEPSTATSRLRPRAVERHRNRNLRRRTLVALRKSNASRSSESPPRHRRTTSRIAIEAFPSAGTCTATAGACTHFLREPLKLRQQILPPRVIEVAQLLRCPSGGDPNFRRPGAIIHQPIARRPHHRRNIRRRVAWARPCPRTPGSRQVQTSAACPSRCQSKRDGLIPRTPWPRARWKSQRRLPGASRRQTRASMLAERSSKITMASGAGDNAQPSHPPASGRAKNKPQQRHAQHPVGQNRGELPQLSGVTRRASAGRN